MLDLITSLLDRLVWRC